MSASVEFVSITEGHFYYTAFDKYGQEWQRSIVPRGAQHEWIRINGPAVIPPDTEKDTLRAQVAGLTKGISKFMCDEKSLRKRLAENERALAKRKKQTQIDSKQNAELFRDLFLICDSVVNGAQLDSMLLDSMLLDSMLLDVKRATFEEFKDGWLKKNV